MARLRLSLPVLLSAAAVLSSCATATIDNAVPQAALESPAQQAVPVQPAMAATAPVANAALPDNTGQYPNINVMPVGETEQFTQSDEAATRALLDDAKAGQQAQGESTAAYQERLKRLRLLAKSHASDTIKQIEGQ